MKRILVVLLLIAAGCNQETGKKEMSKQAPAEIESQENAALFDDFQEHFVSEAITAEDIVDDLGSPITAGKITRFKNGDRYNIQVGLKGSKEEGILKFEVMHEGDELMIHGVSLRVKGILNMPDVAKITDAMRLRNED